jgi:hypothetical protein
MNSKYDSLIRNITMVALATPVVLGIDGCFEYMEKRVEAKVEQEYKVKRERVPSTLEEGW